MSKVDAEFIRRLVAEQCNEVAAAVRRNHGYEEFAMDYAELARQVSKSLGRDKATKQRLLMRNPGLAFALDAGEVEGMSAAELAARECKERKLEYGDNDPIAVLDAFHAGVAHARSGGRPSGMDGAAGSSFMDKYLSGTE
jgi:hypothetical protein